ncbi:MAG: alpha/beta hydrolase [Nanoarchaeota archaeon]
MAEKLFFGNGAGIRLCGILSSKDATRPIVIQCHGFSSSKDSKTYPPLELALGKEGIASFRFDFFGHGESQGKFEDITITEGVRDLEAAISFVKGLGFNKIGLFGSSFGGMIVLLIAAKHPEVRAVVAKCPVSDYIGKIVAKYSDAEMKAWEKTGYIIYTNSNGREFPLKKTFLTDSKRHSVYTVAKRIRAPTLIIHGDADVTVPPAQSQKTASLIPHCTLDIIQGVGHDFLGKEAEVNAQATVFLAEKLFH